MHKIASEFTDFVRKNKPDRADYILHEIYNELKSKFGEDPQLSKLLLFHIKPGMSSTELAERFGKSNLSEGEERTLYNWLFGVKNSGISAVSKNMLEEFSKEYDRKHTTNTPAVIKGRLPPREKPLPKIELQERPVTQEDWAIKDIDNPPKFSDDESDTLIRFASIFSKSI